MKKLIVSTLFLFFLFPSLIPAPIIPVQEVPQEHYGPVFSYICQAWLGAQEKAERLGQGKGMYKRDQECTWFAYSKNGRLEFLFSVSMDPSNLSEMKEKSGWEVFSSSPETFKRYSSEVMLLNPEAEAVRLKLKPLVSAFGQYLPWTLIEPGFAGEERIVEGALKIMEKMEIFSELKSEHPRPAPIEVKP